MQRLHVSEHSVDIVVYLAYLAVLAMGPRGTRTVCTCYCWSVAVLGPAGIPSNRRTCTKRTSVMLRLLCLG